MIIIVIRRILLHTIATHYNNVPLLSQRMLADPFETLIQTEDEHSIMQKK